MANLNLIPQRKIRQSDWDKLYEKWSQTDKVLDKQRIQDQSSFANIDKQMGKGMYSNELISRITRLNSQVWAEDSINKPGYVGFYTARNGQKVYCGAACKKGYLTEFAVVVTDAADLPVGIEPGWRMVLMRLCQFGALTKKQVLETWGDVAYQDARGKHWHLWMKDLN